MVESRSVLLGAGYGRVLVLPHDGQPVGVRPRMGELPLLVDARLVLRMRRETIVRDGEVVVVPLKFLASRQTNHLLINARHRQNRRRVTL